MGATLAVITFLIGASLEGLGWGGELVVGTILLTTALGAASTLLASGLEPSRKGDKGGPEPSRNGATGGPEGDTVPEGFSGTPSGS